jgi:HSP20 family molecular chaperone IbpA
VTIHEGRLIISGVRKPAPKSGKCWYNEQTYGRFERVIALSDLFDTDSINAELSDGILL